MKFHFVPFVLLSFLLNTFCFSQTTINLYLTAESKLAPLRIKSTTPASQQNSTSTLGDTIFYESFENGINGDGNNGAWSTYGIPSAALWEYRGTSTIPDLTIGSRGAYTTGLTIQSETANNGFMIFDSDFLDNGGIAGMIGTGIAPVTHTGYLESPIIDLSNYQHVMIELTSYFRTYISAALLEFSTDGGTTYSDSIFLYWSTNAIYSTTFNSETSTNHKIITSLPQGIGGNSKVKVRFRFDASGTLSTIDMDGYYFWQLDDVRLIEGSTDPTSTYLESNIEHKFIVYPNPSSGHLSINFDKPQEEVGIRLINSKGQLIYKLYEERIEKEFKITIPHIRKGNYILEVNSNHLKNQVQNIIIE